MTGNDKIIIAFDNTHHALKAEEILETHGIPFKTRMAPRDLSAECGLVLVIDTGMSRKAHEHLMEEKQLTIVKFYQYRAGAWTPFDINK